jgi:hypothetical protein
MLFPKAISGLCIIVQTKKRPEHNKNTHAQSSNKFHLAKKPNLIAMKDWKHHLG